MATAGEALENLRAAKRLGRDRYTVDLDRAIYDDGWKDGYAAGFQQALSSVQGSLTAAIAAQRSGIMSTADLV